MMKPSNNHALVPAPAHMEEPILRHLDEIGRIWAESSLRPRISNGARVHWGRLIDEWAESELPLLIRRSSGIRGAAAMHGTGRRILFSDNSPAQWSFMCAYRGELLTLGDIRDQLAKERIPVSFASKRSEKDQIAYSGHLTKSDSPNTWKWKLCHIDPVGLNSRMPVESIPLVDLKDHFKKLLKPENHFLIPLAYSGLGEVDEVIGAMKDALEGEADSD
jgi:hypothetical protein